MCDLDPTMHALYVNSSVIKKSLVGTQFMPLLRVVPTGG